jgi:hypothetical protein
MAAPSDPTATSANVVVLASKGGKECARSSTVAVNIADLQEMQNHMRETIDQGLQDLQAKQGKGGLPPAPPSAQAQPVQAEYAAVAPPPDPKDAADLQQQAQQAEQAEKEVAAEAGGAPQSAGQMASGPADAPPASPPAAAPSIGLGQTIAEVTASLGSPKSVARVGPKTIYNYDGMKVIFKDGKVADVQ